MRTARLRLVGWSLVAAAALLTGLAATLSTFWSLGAQAAAAMAAAAVVAGVWTARAGATLQRADAHRQALARSLILDQRGHVPLVRTIADPVRIGVHPAAERSVEGTADRAPQYIPRDVDQQLRKAMMRDRFVLLVGESTAGKSRTAFEAVHALFSEHRLIAPVSRTAVPPAIEAAVGTARSVLWLDDLERFLGLDGLTLADVTTVLAGTSPGTAGRIIVATMRSQEYARYGYGTGLDRASGESTRLGREVLRAATRIDLDRRWSRDELARAEEHYDDPRVRRALDHADAFGVCEYVAAGPQLLAAWRDGWAPGVHPRGCALVLAAVNARHAGIHRPLPASLLQQLHEPYLHDRGGILLRPEPIDAAIDWTTSPLHATSSLLLPQSDGQFLAFDYLIDAIQREPIPVAVLEQLLAFATPDEALRIGEVAWGFHQLDQTEAAFAQAHAGGLWDGTVRWFHIVRNKYGHPAGLRLAKDVLEQRRHGLGPLHPDTLQAQAEVARETFFGEEYTAALELFRRLHDASVSVHGEDHLRSLDARCGIAESTCRLGDHAAAVGLFTALANDCARVLEPDWVGQYSRICLARCLAHLGDVESGIRVLDDIIADASTGKLPVEEESERALRHERTGFLRLVGRHTEAITELEALASEYVAAEGPLSGRALIAREEIGARQGEHGNAAVARDYLQAVLDHTPWTPNSSRHSLELFVLRRGLAHWTGEAGDPSSAVRQLQELVETVTHARGAEDGYTLGVRRRLACWTGRAGDPDEALRQLEQLHAEACAALGEFDEVTQTCRADLEHWKTHNADSATR